MNARDIEIAVADYFDYRRCLIVPNVSWGLFRHQMEVDLLVVQPSSWAYEVEIKVSASDIKADKGKYRHALSVHYPEVNELLRKKFFAVPEKLKDHPDIPDNCGIFAIRKPGLGDAVYSSDGEYKAVLVRPAKVNKGARELTSAEIQKVQSLAGMRIWNLKKALQRQPAAAPADGRE